MTSKLSRLIVKAGHAFNIIIMNFVSSHGYSESSCGHGTKAVIQNHKSID